MKYSKEISNRLNELLEKNYDAEKGYLNAAENVQSNRLQDFFRERSAERSQFAKELRTEILSYGQIPEDSGSIKAAMHRNWMSLKSLLSSNNEEAIIEETLKGENASLEEYEKILEFEEFAPSTQAILENHKQTIQAAINSLKYQEEIVS